MKKLIIIVSLIFLCSKGLAIPDSVLESFPIEGMKGLSRINQSEVDEFNRRMENLHWGRSVTRDVTPRGGAIGNLIPTEFGESKYDTELSPQDLLSEKSINQLREEKRAEDIEEYFKYFLCVGCVIIVLIAVAQSRERID